MAHLKLFSGSNNGPGIFSSEKPPPRKFQLYIFLMFITTVFIILYSYPLEINTNIFSLKNIYVGDRESELLNTELKKDNFVEKPKPFKSIYTGKDVKPPISAISHSIGADELKTDILNTPASLTLPYFAAFRNHPINSKTLKNSPNKTYKSSVIHYASKYILPSNRNITSKQREINKNVFKLSKEYLGYGHSEIVTTRAKKLSTKSDIEKGFLVYSKHCKIPDIDPMSPSIQQYVEKLPPLNCKTEPPITKTKGNLLIVDEDAIEARNLTDVKCCYMAIYRDEEGISDNKYRYGKCKRFYDTALIREEFIRVRCRNYENEIIYKEFHSFIHDKPSVEKRCDKHKQPAYSVMVIGIDGVSRLNVHRHMNKTVSYLLNNMKAVEMFGFNKIGDNTFPNLVAMLLGYKEKELSNVCWNAPLWELQPNLNESLDKCNFIWKEFAEKGYRTLFAEDSPEMSTFNYAKKGFLYQPTDYYFRHFILPYEEELGWEEIMNCYMCVGSVSVPEALLHWTDSFSRKFKDKAYFSFTWINSPTHDDLNYASKVDHIYEKFFASLHGSGVLKNTIVFVMSDHGVRYGRIRQTYIGRLEERLPFLFISLPEDFQKNYPEETKSLRINSHRLVTPFDLHATLQNILHLQEKDWIFRNRDNVTGELARNFTKRAQSLFKTVPLERSCDDAFIEQHYCTCKASLPRNQNDVRGKQVAEFIIAFLNKMLKPVSDVCVPLELHSVNDVQITFPVKENITSYEELLNDIRTPIPTEELFYTVIVQTKPNDAIFEGTVHISPPEYEFELTGSISRLNMYGKESHCVNDAILKKYCYCKDNTVN